MKLSRLEFPQHPKPPQRFTPVAFLAWIDKKLAEGWRIVSCYEAGPLGFVLHRQLIARGVTNYVVRPRSWDENHSRVKTDARDALWMLNALDRFCAGNKKALAVVRVPTEEQERRRTQTRLRQSFVRDPRQDLGLGELGLVSGDREGSLWAGSVDSGMLSSSWAPSRA